MTDDTNDPPVPLMYTEKDAAAQLRRENDFLRRMVAESDLPCVYCQLPKADMARCASGFPGCARGDDMIAHGDVPSVSRLGSLLAMVPLIEQGAGLIREGQSLIEQLETQIEELQHDNDRLRARLRHVGHRVVPPGWSGPAEDF